MHLSFILTILRTHLSYSLSFGEDSGGGHKSVTFCTKIIIFSVPVCSPGFDCFCMSPPLQSSSHSREIIIFNFAQSRVNKVDPFIFVGHESKRFSIQISLIFNYLLGFPPRS